MKNEATLKSMAKMIQAMLPYEPEYKPASLGTVCLSEMFGALKIRSPQIVEFEGVFNYVLKGMDIKNDSKLDDFLVELRDILINSYPMDDKEKTEQEKRDWVTATHIDTSTEP